MKRGATRPAMVDLPTPGRPVTRIAKMSPDSPALWDDWNMVDAQSSSVGTWCHWFGKRDRVGRDARSGSTGVCTRDPFGYPMLMRARQGGSPRAGGPHRMHLARGGGRGA